jgi:hypothetical protein
MHELRSGRWRRSSHGQYVPVNTARTPGQRVVEASAILSGGYGAVGGWAAAHWCGAPFFDGLDPAGEEERPVLLCIGPERHLSRQSGVELSRERLPSSDIQVVRGVCVTSPLRTAFDLARRASSLTEAVVALDTLLECGLVDHDVLREYVKTRFRWNGLPQARSAVDLAVIGVRSPPETRLRLTWIREAGLPRFLVNRPLFTLDGRLIGIPDGFDDESATAAEYDGEEHELEANRAADRERDAFFTSCGIRLVRANRSSMEDREELIKRMKLVRRAGLNRDRALDNWTLQPPPGFDPTRYGIRPLGEGESPHA